MRASKDSVGLALVHGFAMNIALLVNVLSLCLASEGKIWVMAAKLKDEQGTLKVLCH